jgi:hypothetical protein
MLGPKGAWRGEPGDGQAADLCIDMHTTTSNMGCTLIVDRWCALGLHAAAHVCAQWEAACGAAGVSVAAFPCRVLVDDVLQAESTYVCTAARHGLMIEVGPTAQGLLRADCVAATEVRAAVRAERHHSLSIAIRSASLFAQHHSSRMLRSHAR